MLALFVIVVFRYSNYTIYLGVDNTKSLKNDEIQDRTVEKAFPHENYDKNAFIDDIMLLKVKTNKCFIFLPFALVFSSTHMPKS